MTTTPPAPAVTAHADADPCPRVEVLVTPMPGDAATINVWRSYEGRTELVRGAVGATVVGDFLVVDYEAPIGVDVAYTCQTGDAGGTPSDLSELSDVVQLEVTDAWASDPLDPSTSMPWTLARQAGVAFAAAIKRGSFTGMTFGADQSLATSVGSTLPIGSTSARRAASRIPIAVATYDDEHAAQMQDLLMQANPICLRLPPRSVLKLMPPKSYLQIGDVVPSADPSGGRVVWSMSADSVVPPGIGVIVPVRTYADLASEASTYGGLSALYATYLDLQRGA
jgi:hypothetical protein